MSDEMTQETEKTDKDQNFEAVRTQLAEKDAEIARLRQFEYESQVRSAGFDPSTGIGKSLIRDLAAGVVEGDVGSYADTEYGWKPDAPLSSTEKLAVDGSRRQTELSQVSSSDDPPDLQTQINEATLAGDHRLARSLKNRMLYEQMASQARGG